MSARATRCVLSLIACLFGAFGLLAHATAQSSGTAYSIELQASINPATAKWVSSALEDAADEDAALAVIQLDTPGGLDDSMRDIVQDILAAPMPVVVYVSPNGARAASAGVFITEAADVAAMAPQTNIGSASPVSIGGGDVGDVLGRKITNDAAAYVRALAEGHERDGDLAERMVTEAVNVTSTEALRAGLIDVIAPSEEELLQELDGFEVQGPKAQTLDTDGLEISQHDMPLQYEILDVIVNPTVSYLLLLIGLVGLGIELFSPGIVLPGALGAISFLLGLYGSAQLPVTFAGVALLVIGVAMIIAEAHVTAGFLGAAGVIAIAASGLILYDTDTEAFEVSAPVVIVAGVVIGGLMAFAAKKAVEARRRPARTGWEEMVGASGDVRQRLDPAGQVFVEGALWRAEPEAGVGPLEPGVRVRVTAVDGLTVKVRPVKQEGDT